MTDASDEYTRVLETLGRVKAMPFLEIIALCRVNNARLQEILAEMERKKLVRVAREDSVLDEIVTLRE
jgi:hypothetical protein